MLHYAREGRYIPASLNCGAADLVGWKKKKERIDENNPFSSGFVGGLQVILVTHSHNILLQHAKKEIKTEYCTHHGFKPM